MLFKTYAKYGKLGPKYKKAYDKYVAKMNYLADEMLAAELELNDKLLQLRAGKMTMNDLQKEYRRLINEYDELNDLQEGLGKKPKGRLLSLVKKLFFYRLRYKHD